MNAAFRLMLWYLIFNLCTGLFLQIMPAFEENGATGGLFYNKNDGLLFIEDMNKTVSPTKDLTDESSTLDAAMNYIQLGVVWRWLSVIDDLLWGSLNILYRITCGYFESATQADLVFNFLKGFVLIGYILAAFSLWTEKDI